MDKHSCVVVEVEWVGRSEDALFVDESDDGRWTRMTIIIKNMTQNGTRNQGAIIGH
jgi:hypothetical protein